MKKVFFITEHLSSYRIPFFNLIESQEKLNLRVLTGSKMFNNFGGEQENCHFRMETFKPIYLGIGKFKLLWFKNLITYIKSNKPDILIISNNLKWIQNIFLFLIKSKFDYEIFIWGHGVRTHSKLKFFKKVDPFLLRLLSKKLIKGFLVYTDLSKRYLLKNGINENKIHVFNNTVDIESNRKIYSSITQNENSQIKYITVIGRLINSKNPYRALKYWDVIKNEFHNIKLLFIGSGKLENELKTHSDNTVIYSGELFDETEIVKYITNTKIIFSPGASGLNIVHAFSYGKPFITFSGNNHGPEIEYIEDGVNGYILNNDFSANILKIKQLLTDEVKYNNFARAAWQSGSQLKLQSMVDKFSAAIQKNK